MNEIICQIIGMLGWIVFSAPSTLTMLLLAIISEAMSIIEGEHKGHDQ